MMGISLLNGVNSIIGRSIIIHKGDGKRVAQCVIGIEYEGGRIRDESPTAEPAEAAFCELRPTNPAQTSAASALANMGAYPGGAVENQAEGRVTIGKVTVAHGKALRKYSSSSPASYPRAASGLPRVTMMGRYPSIIHSLISAPVRRVECTCMKVQPAKTLAVTSTLQTGMGTDPWNVVKYSADEFGNAAGSFEIKCGYDLKDIIGRTFVVHDGNGQRVACTELVENNEALAFQYDMTGVLEKREHEHYYHGWSVMRQR